MEPVGQRAAKLLSFENDLTLVGVEPGLTGSDRARAERQTFS